MNRSIRCVSATLAATLLWLPGPALAINIRDDVAANVGGIGNYGDFTNSFPNVGNLMGADGNNFCTGTLLNERTVITAAHCFYENDKSITPGLDTARVSFDAVSVYADRWSEFASITLHPQYGHENNVADMQDVAIITLATPVTTIPFAEIATQTPVPGTQITLVGYGTSGTGSNGSSNIDNIRRIATNTLDIVDDIDLDTGGPTNFTSEGDTALIFDFDDPLTPGDSQTGLSTALALEGASGGGDSGGALWAMVDGRLMIIGLNNSSINLVDEARDGGYGELIVFTTVAPLTQWIDENNPLIEISAVAGNGDWFDAARWQDNLIPNNSDTAFRVGDPSTFFNVILDQQGATILNADATIDRLTLASPQARLQVRPGNELKTVLGTNIDAGRLTLNGTLQSSALTLAGGILSGAGIVAAEVTTNAGGRIAPGNSIGTLTIDGNFVQTANGVLAIEIDRTSADKLEVNGTAALDGALGVRLVPGGAIPLSDTDYVIVTAAGGITGGFSQVRDGLPGTLRVSNVQVNANDVRLSIGAQSFAETSSSAAGRSIGAALDSLRGTGNSTVDAVLSQLAVLDTPARELLFATLAPSQSLSQSASGFSYAATLASQLGIRTAALRNGTRGVTVAQLRLAGAQLASSNATGDALRSAAQRARAAEEEARAFPHAPTFSLPDDIGVFIAGDVSFGDTDVLGGTQDFTTSGLTAGIDYRVTPDLAIGVAASVSATSSDMSFGGATEQRAYGGSVYGTWRSAPDAPVFDGDMYVDAYAGAATTSSDTSRIARIGATQINAQSDTSGTTISAGVRAGHVTRIGQTSIGPVLALDYAHIHTDAYSERGAGAFGLNVAESNEASITSTLGIQAAHELSVLGWDVAPYTSAGWVHEFEHDAPVATASFAGAAGTSFQTTGLARDKDWVRAGGGVAVRAGSATLINAGINTDLGRSGVNRTQVSLTMRSAF
ncbi:serine protease [Candidatus Phaeomarinobacter ectocarpi]|uniref:Serine protease n=1 Tax=Candidatus Phaeomarinibacter ectocarpi TaxID=1458461 RepID=X5MLH2_9HYPH|nr:autotransporter domain-containing protein [Candidatus Phaeomarinobacter ectocarpi]CDO59485.1 serine protease [Candidatus Phaeomarinobacter ectocarpi]